MTSSVLEKFLKDSDAIERWNRAQEDACKPQDFAELPDCRAEATLIILQLEEAKASGRAQVRFGWTFTEGINSGETKLAFYALDSKFLYLNLALLGANFKFPPEDLENILEAILSAECEALIQLKTTVNKEKGTSYQNVYIQKVTRSAEIDYAEIDYQESQGSQEESPFEAEAANVVLEKPRPKPEVKPEVKEESKPVRRGAAAAAKPAPKKPEPEPEPEPIGEEIELQVEHEIRFTKDGQEMEGFVFEISEDGKTCSAIVGKKPVTGIVVDEVTILV